MHEYRALLKVSDAAPRHKRQDPEEFFCRYGCYRRRNIAVCGGRHCCDPPGAQSTSVAREQHRTPPGVRNKKGNVCPTNNKGAANPLLIVPQLARRLKDLRRRKTRRKLLLNQRLATSAQLRFKPVIRDTSQPNLNNQTEVAGDAVAVAVQVTPRAIPTKQTTEIAQARAKARTTSHHLANPMVVNDVGDDEAAGAVVAAVPRAIAMSP